MVGSTSSQAQSPSTGGVGAIDTHQIPTAILSVVLTARGAVFITKRSIWDFPHEGSPTKSKFMSPRKCVPFARFFSVPPIICNSIPALGFAWPQIEGANERARSWKASGRLAICLMFPMSSVTNGRFVISLIGVMLVAMSLDGYTPVVTSDAGPGKLL